MIAQPEENNFQEAFSTRYLREFGFDLENRELLVDDIRVRAIASQDTFQTNNVIQSTPGKPCRKSRCFFKEGWLDTPVYILNDLGAGQVLTARPCSFRIQRQFLQSQALQWK